jgi:hypothetical protein
VKQLYLARDVTISRPCSGSFTTIHGIPCYHEIRLQKQLKHKITKHDFHKHWHFVQPVSAPQDGEAAEVLPPPPPSLPASQPNIFAPHVVKEDISLAKERFDQRIKTLLTMRHCEAL